MPGREIPLVNGEIYHVFNRGIANQPVFSDKRDSQRFLDLMDYYRNKTVPVRYSYFLVSSPENRKKIIKDLTKNKNLLVKLLCFCLMPNHFHLLLKQATTSGISKFLSNLTNGYTRYFNTKTQRVGPLFQGKFRAIRIETDEQLSHIARYIHLNPFSSFVIKKIDGLADYPYSSLREYLKLRSDYELDKDLILGQFKTFKNFKDFTFDQANYQRQLQKIKHLTLEI